MIALRSCLDCGLRTRTTAPRCGPCERSRQRRRNAARSQYAGAWRATSRTARRRQPWCSICGTTDDLTLDHEHAQVECRSCNSSHRRNAS